MSGDPLSEQSRCTTAPSINEQKQGTKDLPSRLDHFLRWLDAAGATIHPGLQLVVSSQEKPNDSSKQDDSPDLTTLSSGNGKAALRLGVAGDALDCSTYDGTIGCSVVAKATIDKDEVLMTVPQHIFLTPNVIAASKSGKAVASCCCFPSIDKSSFWDAFQNTALLEQQYQKQLDGLTGTELMNLIVETRRGAATHVKRAGLSQTQTSSRSRVMEATPSNLVEYGVVSTRAPLLAFLIYERFCGIKTAIGLSTVNDESGTVFPTPTMSNLSFTPYAHVLPSVVSLPLCWKDEDLSLLEGCVSGLSVLREVAASTLQLAREFVSLIDSGLQERFPVPDVLTWSHWIWAASVFASRALPATCYYGDATDLQQYDKDGSVSNGVWKELGVMVPLLDMLNHHDANSAQVLWTVQASEKVSAPHGVSNKAVLPGQIFCCYGEKTNHVLTTQYGFARRNNSADGIEIGWRLNDAVPAKEETDASITDISTTPEFWWSPERQLLLQSELNLPNTILDRLRRGEAMIVTARGGGDFDPVLLSASVVATMSPSGVRKALDPKKTTDVQIDSAHLERLKKLLSSFFLGKLHKLERNIASGLESRFESLATPNQFTVAWTELLENHGGFFTVKAGSGAAASYTATPVGCCLTLLDGHLGALQESIAAVSATDKRGAKNDEVIVAAIKDAGYSFVHDKDHKVDDRKRGERATVVESDRKKSRKDGGNNK